MLARMVEIVAPILARKTSHEEKQQEAISQVEEHDQLTKIEEQQVH